MKRMFAALVVLITLGMGIVGCAAQYVPSVSPAVPGGQSILASSIPPATATATPSPTRDAEQDAKATMIFLLATDTAVAAEKTEMANLALQQTQVQATYDQMIFSTNVAQQTAVAATAIATQTYGAQTAIATITQGAATQSVANTNTAIANTKIVEKDKLNATRFGIWSLVILVVLLLLIGSGLGLAFLFTKIYGTWMEQKARNIQNSKIEPDQHGRFPIVPASALPGKNNEKIVNPNLAHRAVTDLAHDDLSTEQALANTQSQRVLDATRALAESPVFARKMLTATKPGTGENEAMPNAEMDIRKLGIHYLGEGVNVVPAWSLFESWDGKGGIPYGVSDSGLEQVSIQQVPHGGVFGKTGSGKSRGFLRPFIAGAIASGQRVVIIGKEVDFWPFAQHPNVKMIGVRNVTEEAEAGRYADYLKRIVEEMNRRDEVLTTKRVSTWDKAGFENTLIVLDELGNALDMMPTAIRQEAHRWVGGLVREGRKYGFNLWLASQRAVGFKSIVEQLGRAVFYLADAEASRYALGFPGAETLSEGQFIAKFHRTQKCAAFDPSDEELVTFLQGRTVKTHEPITWIEGSVVGETKDEGGRQKAEDEVLDSKIRQVLLRMKETDNVSLSNVEREVFGAVKGGSQYRRIQKIWMEVQGKSTTTDNNMPGSDPLPA